MQRMRVVRSSHEWTTNELMNDDRGDKKDGHGNAAGMIGLTGLVALVAVGMLWSISSRKSTNQAVAGLNDMFAEVQQSADAAAAASSPLSLDTSSACVIYKPAGSSVSTSSFITTTRSRASPRRDPSCGSRTATRSPAARTTSSCRSPRE
jgi:uncharacterized iron-regulated membrane protein